MVGHQNSREPQTALTTQEITEQEETWLGPTSEGNESGWGSLAATSLGNESFQGQAMITPP